jgi:glycosyltransferase involved in cell wall biosynthesis
MKIAFYHHGIPFDGSTPFTQPLGGSESSVVYMARSLQSLGHQVTVYAKCPRSGESFDGVLYQHYHQFFTDYTSRPWDVVISFRSFDPFLVGRVAPRMIFWCGDAYDQPVLENFGHQALQQHIDLVFCVSNWHRQTFIKHFDLSPEKVIATRNGFCRELVPPSPNKNWARAAYTSTPFRGLDILLQMFPKMRKSRPHMSLDVFSGMQVYGWTKDADEKEFAALYKAASQPGVTLHGSIPQPVLLQCLANIGLLLYPNTYPETSCIAAIEAQASGCVVITSALAGLNETVENGSTGVCIKGDPQSSQYQRDFVATVRQLLDNPSRLLQVSRTAQKRAFRIYDWSAIAQEWADVFAQMPALPVHPRWSGPLMLLQKGHEYLHNGNVSAVSRVLSALEQTPFLRNEVESLKGQLSTWM